MLNTPLKNLMMDLSKWEKLALDQPALSNEELFSMRVHSTLSVVFDVYYLLSFRPHRFPTNILFPQYFRRIFHKFRNL